MDGAGDLAPQPQRHDVRDIAMLLARFACNNHTICDEELRPIGTISLLQIVYIVP